VRTTPRCARTLRLRVGCYLLELLDRSRPRAERAARWRRLFRFALDSFEAIAAHRPDPALLTILELRAARCARAAAPSCGAASAAAASSPRVSGRLSTSPTAGRCAARGAAARSGVLPVHVGTLRSLARPPRSRSTRVSSTGLILSARAVEEARSVVGRFQRFHVGVELRSQRFSDRMLGGKPREPLIMRARP